MRQEDAISKKGERNSASFSQYDLLDTFKSTVRQMVLQMSANQVSWNKDSPAYKVILGAVKISSSNTVTSLIRAVLAAYLVHVMLLKFSDKENRWRIPPWHSSVAFLPVGTEIREKTGEKCIY